MTFEKFSLYHVDRNEVSARARFHLRKFKIYTENKVKTKLLSLIFLCEICY